jgi:ATP-binding cassette subfamily F protein 3
MITRSITPHISNCVRREELNRLRQFEDQKKMISDNQLFIDRFKGTYSKATQVQSRIKMLEKMEVVDVDEEDTSALRLRFPPAPRSGSYPVTVERFVEELR